MIRKRSVTIAGHRTSFSLEDAFHEALQTLAGDNGKTLAALIGEIDSGRPRTTNLSAALRLHVLDAARRGLLPLENEPTEC